MELIMNSWFFNIHKDEEEASALWYKMYTYHRTHHQRRKRTGRVTIIARRTDDHDYGQDRDNHHDRYIGGTYA